jgi:hypothetical protein
VWIDGWEKIADIKSRRKQQVNVDEEGGGLAYYQWLHQLFKRNFKARDVRVSRDPQMLVGYTCERWI